MAIDDLRADGYEASYASFDSPLMRRLRRDAYGEDIGQHSWVAADELRADIHRLELHSTSRLLDLGCGPCGPLTFVLSNVGCAGTGLERSAEALRIGRARADSAGVASLLTVQESDLNAPLPFGPHSFDAAMSLDVVCHICDRAKLFHEVARVLSPGGRFLFTDPGVVTGSLSSDEVRRRSMHGYTEFVAVGWNEAMLESAGFRLIETEDRTMSVLRNAGGRLAAVQAHRAELEHAQGAASVQAQQDYLQIVIELARRRALSRVMYLGEARLPRGAARRSGEP
jgi:SAM-dependent methyltransferase